METIINAIKTWVLNLVSNKADKATVAVSDWNNNDPESPAFIKNRPFYDMTTTVVCDEIGTRVEDERHWKTYAIFTPFRLTTKNGTYYSIKVGSLPSCLFIQQDAYLKPADDYAGHYHGGEGFLPSQGRILCLERIGENPRILIKIAAHIYKIEEKYLPDRLIGQETVASGSYSHAEGNETTASGDYSHAEGDGATASGEASHAEGYDTTASGYYSHAEGAGTKAIGNYSHVEGDATAAYSIYGHAEGVSSQAVGEASHAEGYLTHASRNYSHAEGWCSTASGEISHAEGTATLATHKNQHVQGAYNIADPSTKTGDFTGTYAHIVGNGASGSNRSNAHTLDWQGNAWYAGDVYVGSTSGKDKDAGSKKLATEDFVTQAIAALRAELQGG